MKKREIKIHFFIWVAYLVYYLVIDRISYGEYFNIVREVYILLVEIWIFYSFYYSMTTTSSRKFKKILFSILCFSLSFSGMLLLNYFRELIAKHYGAIMYERRVDFYIDSIIFYTQFGIYALGYFYFTKLLKKQKEVNSSNQKLSLSEKVRLESENRVLKLDEEKIHLQTKLLLSEKEKLQSENEILRLREEKNTLQRKLLESEINYLRAQINPHFLFNCLNFFHAQAMIVNPLLSESIIKLSEIMRYSLNDFSKTGGKAKLEEELIHIQNVIEIHQIRFDKKLEISLFVNGNAIGIQLAPMILITLVENIFKHGDLQDIAYPAKIICTIDEEKNKVIFSTSNKIKVGTTAPSSGIGLENIELRLTQLYANNYRFNHVIENNIFFVEIQFPYLITGQITTPTFYTSSLLV